MFYDLEKAYDWTWRYGILKDLHNTGLRGKLPEFIVSFLKDRTMSVRIRETESVERGLENGVPQGSVLSVIFFTLKINGIVKEIPADSRFHISLYVDDLQIGYHYSEPNVIQEKMQNCLIKIGYWAQLNGFNFSPTNSKAMHFHAQQHHLNSPALKLSESELEYCDTIKFLGLVWEKMNWKAHIAQLSNKCKKTHALLRCIAANELGADQQSLMMLYRTLIRSRLEYGYELYGPAARLALSPVCAITNEALRIETGVFKTTPINNLYIFANEMPPDLRREYLTLKYYFKVRSQLDNPALAAAVLPDDRLFTHKRLIPHFAIRAAQILEELSIRKTGVKPEFSYNIQGISTPTWSIKQLEINIYLWSHLWSWIRGIEDKGMVKQEFMDIRDQYLQNSKHVYTDGSKSEQGVGVAAVLDSNVMKTAFLLKES